MALQCQRCNGKSVVYDRSLGGRAICSVCGAPMIDIKTKSIRQQKQAKVVIDTKKEPIRREIQPKPARGTKVKPIRRQKSSSTVTTRRNKQQFTVKAAISWLLPIGLIASYIYITMNPRVVSHWLAPYSPSSKNSWWIKTPADVELLIDQAQKADREFVEQSLHKTIRELIARLQDKGVRLLISDMVTEHAGGEWDPGMAEIRIRPSTVTMGSSVLAEALAHEAAHVSQSCRAGGLGRNSEPLGIRVNTANVFKYQLGSTLYKGPPSSKAIELEAYSVGANPPWAILLLDHFCKG